MKALIIYCSDYRHNTERIARVFAEKTHGDAINLRDIGKVNTEEYDLIGFGSGVYRESLSEKLIKLAGRTDVAGKQAFVFSTSGVGMKYYNHRLIRLLVSKGAVIKGSFACKGSFSAREFTDKKVFDFMARLSQGHPDDRDIKKAERFISRVVGLL